MCGWCSPWSETCGVTLSRHVHMGRSMCGPPAPAGVRIHKPFVEKPVSGEVGSIGSKTQQKSLRVERCCSHAARLELRLPTDNLRMALATLRHLAKADLVVLKRAAIPPLSTPIPNPNPTKPAPFRQPSRTPTNTTTVNNKPNHRRTTTCSSTTLTPWVAASSACSARWTTRALTTIRESDQAIHAVLLLYCCARAAACKPPAPCAVHGPQVGMLWGIGGWASGRDTAGAWSLISGGTV